MKALRFLWMLSVAALIVQVVYGYTDLPERLASHFDSSGRADGWSSRDSFIATWYGVIVLVNIWPLVIGPMMRKLPPGLLSLPNKEYWLADDTRREIAIGITRAMLAGIMFATNLLLLMAFDYTLAMNAGGEATFNIWFGMIVQITLTTGIVIWGMVRFSRTPHVPPGAATPS